MNYNALLFDSVNPKLLETSCRNTKIKDMVKMCSSDLLKF